MKARLLKGLANEVCAKWNILGKLELPLLTAFDSSEKKVKEGSKIKNTKPSRFRRWLIIMADFVTIMMVGTVIMVSGKI